ncbi:MAG: hypothetical protein GY811_05040 [Myxococcales bacterium]|nr:hypothetical protein [Myxococcales bacterium]
MLRLALAALITITLFAAQSALAQPGNAPPQPKEPIAIDEEARSDTSATPAMQAAFEEANAALLANRFSEAIRLFDDIAENSRNSELSGAAIAMAEFARRLKTSKAHIAVGAGERGSILASPDKEGGRASFVITTTAAAFYSSFALVDILGIDAFTPITVTVAATTAAGLGLSLYATRDTPIHPAVASAYSTGLIAASPTVSW